VGLVPDEQRDRVAVPHARSFVHPGGAAAHDPGEIGELPAVAHHAEQLLLRLADGGIAPAFGDQVRPPQWILLLGRLLVADLGAVGTARATRRPQAAPAERLVPG